jgi:hypothetical protein
MTSTPRFITAEAAEDGTLDVPPGYAAAARQLAQWLDDIFDLEADDE